jgi:hypothetical protein
MASVLEDTEQTHSDDNGDTSTVEQILGTNDIYFGMYEGRPVELAARSQNLRSTFESLMDGVLSTTDIPGHRHKFVVRGKREDIDRVLAEFRKQEGSALVPLQQA